MRLLPSESPRTQSAPRPIHRLPVAFLQPLHARLRLTPNADDWMVYSTCTDTNGPSSKVYVRPDGILDERVSGDPGYWDPNDPRPWAAHYALGER